MNLKKNALLVSAGLVSLPAFAAFQPFSHDVVCLNPIDNSSLSVSYDKTTFPQFGWQGSLHLKIGSGKNPNIANWIERTGLTSEGTNTFVTRTMPAAGGNWIEQKEADPFNLRLTINFAPYVLQKLDGTSSEQTAYSFISSIDTYKSDFDKDYLFKLVDDYGGLTLKFSPSNCKTLN